MHRVKLYETHEITLPHRGTGRDVNAVVGQCRLAAQTWAEENGVAINPTATSGSDGRAGVTFDIELGHGAMDDLVAPASLWTWSARFHVWLDALTKVAGRQRRTGRIIARPADGMASVTSMRPRNPFDLVDEGDGHRSMVGTGEIPSAFLPRTQDEPPKA